MKLGVLSNLFANMTLEEACKYLSEQGCTAIEIGCGGFPLRIIYRYGRRRYDCRRVGELSRDCRFLQKGP